MKKVIKRISAALLAFAMAAGSLGAVPNVNAAVKHGWSGSTYYYYKTKKKKASTYVPKKTIINLSGNTTITISGVKHSLKAGKYYMAEKTSGDNKGYISLSEGSHLYTGKVININTSKYLKSSEAASKTYEINVTLEGTTYKSSSSLASGRELDGKVYKSGTLYSGFAKKDGKVYKISSGVMGPLYTGLIRSTDEYYDYGSNGFGKFDSSKHYISGVPGAKTSGDDRGLYNSDGTPKKINGWYTQGGKWYYLVGGVAWNNGGSGGWSKSPLNTRSKLGQGTLDAGYTSTNKTLNVYGHGASQDAAYYFYFNKDGSLNTNVFNTDTSWKKKQPRQVKIQVNFATKNVVFLGRMNKSKSFNYALKVVVFTGSKTASIRSKQVRGYKGRGWWGVVSGKGKGQRWFIYKKPGSSTKYYYQWASGIGKSGALFHSPRYLKYKNKHSIYAPHYNAMGVSHIATKCVRLNCVNAKLIFDMARNNKGGWANRAYFVNSSSQTGPFGTTKLGDQGNSLGGRNYDPTDPSL